MTPAPPTEYRCRPSANEACFAVCLVAIPQLPGTAPGTKPDYYLAVYFRRPGEGFTATSLLTGEVASAIKDDLNRLRISGGYSCNQWRYFTATV